MLVTVQIPVIDLRGFVAAVERLALPSWPAPDPDKDFVRSFGPIRRRPSGGLNGWLGEAQICEAERGVRFLGPAPRYFDLKGEFWSFRVVYRRFFADGLAMGKIEVGFDVRPLGHPRLRPQIGLIIEKLLNLPVAVADSIGRRLGGAGADFAKAYARATTPHGRDSVLSQRFVLAGKPSVVVEHSGRPLQLPDRARVLTRKDFEIPLAFWHQRQFETDVPVWLINRHSPVRSAPSRELRMYICRLHADTEAISKVLRAIAIGLVSPESRSHESDRLQRFLTEAFRHQRKLGDRIDTKLDLPFYEQALWHRDHALPGYYDSLLQRVTVINPRPAVQSAIESYVAARQRQDREATIVIMGDYVMTQNNVTNSGIAGVVGGTVKVENSAVTTNQTTLGSTSADAIAELLTLAKILKERAATPDQEVGAAAVENAAAKLSAGDEPGALAWLKRSGAWALKVAEDVSVKLAAELIVRASI